MAFLSKWFIVAFVCVLHVHLTNADTEFCEANNPKEGCYTEITTENRYLPTHSRLKENVVDWHKHYDKNYVIDNITNPLTSSQIEEYYENGFILIKNVIPLNLINDCLSDIDKLIDNIANKLYKKKLVNDLCDDKKYSIFNRLTCLDNQYKGAAVLIHKFGRLWPSFTKIMQYKKLLNIATYLLQPTLSPNNYTEIAVNPIWNLRSKLPFNEDSQVPWHQDLAYFQSASWNVHQLTVWIPFLNINDKNGAIEILRASHKTGNVATHTCCFGNTWYIDLAENVIKNEMYNDNNINLNDYRSIVSMNKGDILIFSNLIPHRSVDNVSDKIRWTIDIRYQINGIPNGFDDIKPNLKVKDLLNDKFIPDWTEWGQIDRNELQHELADMDNIHQDYTSILVGPWMDAWEVVNKNKHTKAYFKD